MVYSKRLSGTSSGLITGTGGMGLWRDGGSLVRSSSSLLTSSAIYTDEGMDERTGVTYYFRNLRSPKKKHLLIC